MLDKLVLLVLAVSPQLSIFAGFWTFRKTPERDMKGDRSQGAGEWEATGETRARCVERGGKSGGGGAASKIFSLGASDVFGEERGDGGFDFFVGAARALYCFCVQSLCS